jgi:hypothetical protein
MKYWYVHLSLDELLLLHLAVWNRKLAKWGTGNTGTYISQLTSSYSFTWQCEVENCPSEAEEEPGGLHRSDISTRRDTHRYAGYRSPLPEFCSDDNLSAGSPNTLTSGAQVNINRPTIIIINQNIQRDASPPMPPTIWPWRIVAFSSRTTGTIRR